MSIFNIQLSIEIAILVFAILFAIGAIFIAILLCCKAKRGTEDVRENPESLQGAHRIQEVSVIQICETKKGKTEKTGKTGNTYVHCPSPTYEPNYEYSNQAFDPEEDFVNVIASF